ncbi:S-(hydroxymethyl)glutathione dehydrogenase/alcohol dehydrogenase [Kitasatospora sp. MAP12-15]|uniref:alcohol dehydrogenase catalytic domain-containing protein n=1 Tax=unclassified Kitasatospora TaxID=2633591 RepID=UPI0024755E75|nr:alcohol dehydrogenase catalytic domain-containing protein [Kitasatospora sp. MAP12-44]MDH6110246.1 S-(hydroxymethyl)glutathione dehydrogenase/alcohol dehydrogenase [Kitasatospora sp. MAP12-44]
MRAAVLHTIGDDDLEVREDVEAVGFGPGRIRVRLRAASLCHSDLSAMSGVLPQPAPFVPGHEGAGDVLAVGEGVRGVAVGDRVVLCWMAPCGHCPHCRRGQGHLCVDSLGRLREPSFRIGSETDAFGFYSTGTFAEEVVVAAESVIKVPDDMPYELAALVGCGATTGLGAAVNTARVEPGASVAVIGAGGVGVAAVQGARVCGAARITVVDPVASRRERALGLGATDAIAPEELKGAARSLPSGGYDYVFEAVGRGATVRAAYDAARRGGAVVVIGAGARDDLAQFSMAELFFNEKRLLPSMYGGGEVARTIELAIELWRSGRLDLAGMITHRVELAEVNTALAQMRSGEALRTVITL